MKYFRVRAKQFIISIYIDADNQRLLGEAPTLELAIEKAELYLKDHPEVEKYGGVFINREIGVVRRN